MFLNDAIFFGAIITIQVRTNIMLTSYEILALAPLSVLAIFYLIADVLTFNRLQVRENGCPILTRPQVVSFVALYPVWVFLVWIENLSTERGNIAVMTIMVLATTIVGRLSTIFVLNDAFWLTRQQWFSLGLRLIINSLWRLNSYLMYGPDRTITTVQELDDRDTNASAPMIFVDNR